MCETHRWVLSGAIGLLMGAFFIIGALMGQQACAHPVYECPGCLPINIGCCVSPNDTIYADEFDESCNRDNAPPCEYPDGCGAPDYDTATRADIYDVEITTADIVEVHWGRVESPDETEHRELLEAMIQTDDENQ